MELQEIVYALGILTALISALGIYMKMPKERQKIQADIESQISDKAMSLSSNMMDRQADDIKNLRDEVSLLRLELSSGREVFTKQEDSIYELRSRVRELEKENFLLKNKIITLESSAKQGEQGGALKPESSKY